MNEAVSATKTERSKADQTRIWRRDHRSMRTPANGPTSEYGRYSTAKAAAPAAGLGNVSALKKTYVPTPAVMMPSPPWEISRVANRRRKFRSARTARRSARKEPFSPCRRPIRPVLAVACQQATSPRMNFSTRSRHTSSPYCSGGDFMK